MLMQLTNYCLAIAKRMYGNCQTIVRQLPNNSMAIVKQLYYAANWGRKANLLHTPFLVMTIRG